MSDSIEAPPTRPQVKLIVWDLDDTLWSGTLSEGDVTLSRDRRELLEGLVDRGVMLSISSRNDPDRARAELTAHDIWDLFIFPRINWNPKGAQVRSLIEAAQLRPENVLFVDDNHLNREEVAHEVPRIQVLDPSDGEFEPRMREILASGKDDRERTRLAEYRLLEAKATAAADFADNTAFLRTCDIHVTVAPADVADTERIHELISRTNQLNYTKRRIDAEAVRAMVSNPAIVTRTVNVRDRFGDYGLVGFVAIEDAAVLHLAFSCRILGMAVGRAIYRHLGSPAIDIAEPVVEALDGPDPDWLSVVDVEQGLAGLDPGSSVPRDPTSPGVLFVGGCDLQAVVGFLAHRDGVDTHFNYSPPHNPRLVIHRDSIDILLADALDDGDRARVLATVPFLDPEAFETPDWAAYKHIVYSPLIDYVQAKYRNDSVPDFYLSYGDIEAPTIDEQRFQLLTGTYGIDPAALRRFVDEWRPVTKPDDVWEGQLERLFSRMASAETVTVLLGATTTFEGLDEQRLPMHRRANALIRKVAARHPNVRLVDVDAYLRDRSDFTDAIRHYGRRVYRDLAVEIGAIIRQTVAEPAPGKAHASAPPRPRLLRILRGIARHARRRATGAVARGVSVRSR